jgi:hypothetical protein
MYYYYLFITHSYLLCAQLVVVVVVAMGDRYAVFVVYDCQLIVAYRVEVRNCSMVMIARCLQ